MSKKEVELGLEDLKNIFKEVLNVPDDIYKMTIHEVEENYMNLRLLSQGIAKAIIAACDDPETKELMTKLRENEDFVSFGNLLMKHSMEVM